MSAAEQAALAGRPGQHDQGYPRAKRILKTDEFSSVFHLRPVQRSAHFVLYVHQAAAHAAPGAQARLGVVAAKRFAPRAVTRNAIKRIAREVFRQSTLPACDCIIRLSRPVNGKSEPAITAGLKSALRSELLTLLQRHFNRELAGEKRR